MSNSTDLIDKAIHWIEERNGAYLAKENVITYYASLTGRASDFQWHSLNLVEVVRIIKATKLTHDSALNQNHIIAACQELGRVYEFGVKSAHKTIDTVFNYYTEANVTVEESVMELIVDEIIQLNYNALFYKNIIQMFNRCIAKLGQKEVSPTVRNKLATKFLSRHNYSLRIGDSRVRYNGDLTQAVILAGMKPADMVEVTEQDYLHITTKIVGALK